MSDELLDQLLKDFKDNHTPKECEQNQIFGGYTLAWVAGYANAKGYSKLTGENLGKKVVDHILDLFEEWEDTGSQPQGDKWEGA